MKMMSTMSDLPACPRCRGGLVQAEKPSRLRHLPLTWAADPPEWVVMLHDDGRTPVVFSPILNGSVVFPETRPVCCLPGDACPEGWSVVGVPHA